MKRIFYVAGVVVGSWTGVALAQQPQLDQPRSEGAAQPSSAKDDKAPTEVVGERMHMTATVQKIDLKKRELTLKGEDGNQVMVQVPDEVSRLDQVKKGDQLEIDYYQSAALSLKKPGDKSGPSEAKVIERTPGKLPGGLVARQITSSVRVLKVDATNNKVTVRGPGGEVDTINVSDPVVQDQLSKIKKGDQVQVTYSEALAATVTPKNKEK